MGAHDENISFAQAEVLLGKELAAQVSKMSIALYQEAAQYAQTRGIIIADTKFEFGLDAAGQLYLIDEALTPDFIPSGRQTKYAPGANHPASTSSTYAIGWKAAVGTNKHQPPHYRRKSPPRPVRNTVKHLPV